MSEIVTHETAAYNMMNVGGSFVKRIGDAYLHADIINKMKLVEAFPHYFEKYGNLEWCNSDSLKKEYEEHVEKNGNPLPRSEAEDSCKM